MTDIFSDRQITTIFNFPLSATSSHNLYLQLIDLKIENIQNNLPDGHSCLLWTCFICVFHGSGVKYCYQNVSAKRSEGVLLMYRKDLLIILQMAMTVWKTGLENDASSLRILPLGRPSLRGLCWGMKVSLASA